MMDAQESNKRLQLEVREELARESSVDPNTIGITADHGLVFLSGHVLGVNQRRSAEEAALRAEGVRAVIDELKIRPGRWEAHDADLACISADCLERRVGLPDGRVKVIVRDGKVRLSGTVTGQDEKGTIATAVREAIGSGGAVDDVMSIEARANPRLVRSHSPTMTPPSEKPVTMPASGGPRVEDSPPEIGATIVVGESFTDEGVSMSQAHHRGFPEIRGEAETRLQSVILLARKLDRAREHAREGWQRDGIDQAIRDVRNYHLRLMSKPSVGTAMDGPGEIQAQPIQADPCPMTATAF